MTIQSRVREHRVTASEAGGGPTSCSASAIRGSSGVTLSAVAAVVWIRMRNVVCSGCQKRVPYTEYCAERPGEQTLSLDTNCYGCIRTGVAGGLLCKVQSCTVNTSAAATSDADTLACCNQTSAMGKSRPS